METDRTSTPDQGMRPDAATPEPVRPEPGAAGRLVGVVGAAGGSGASTAAASLAMTASRQGHRVALVDLDSAGRGLGRAFGVGDEDGIRWAGLSGLAEPLPDGILRSRLPRVDGLHLLTGPWGGTPVAVSARRLALSACLADFELVVLDLPRYEIESTGLGEPDVLVVVSTAEVRSLLLAAELLESRSGSQDVLLLRSDVGAVPISEVTSLGAARLERFPRSRAVAGAADFGTLGEVVGRGSLRRMSLRLLDTVVGRPARRGLR